jgi:hypothetical protein
MTIVHFYSHTMTPVDKRTHVQPCLDYIVLGKQSTNCGLFDFGRQRVAKGRSQNHARASEVLKVTNSRVGGRSNLRRGLKSWREGNNLRRGFM